MAKRIPFKCRFGHIVIYEFFFGTTPSKVNCVRCEEEAGILIKQKNNRFRIGTKELATRM